MTMLVTARETYYQPFVYGPWFKLLYLHEMLLVIPVEVSQNDELVEFPLR